MNWTSIKAYREIESSLPERRLETLKYLLESIQACGVTPTAQELVVYSSRRGYRHAMHVWKRLSELADMHNVIHRGPMRQCSVTLHTVYTWIPGPEKAEDFGKKTKGRRIAERLDFLLAMVPKLKVQYAAFILGVQVNTIEDLPAWKSRAS